MGIWAEQYHVSINTAVYIATCQLLSIAIGPLIWTPLGNKYGRVPILMLSALGSSMFVSGKPSPIALVNKPMAEFLVLLEHCLQ